MKYRTKAELIFQFMEHKTNKPMVLRDFIFTLMYIDELYAARDLMRVSDYDNFFLWHGSCLFCVQDEISLEDVL